MMGSRGPVFGAGVVGSPVCGEPGPRNLVTQLSSRPPRVVRVFRVSTSRAQCMNPLAPQARVPGLGLPAESLNLHLPHSSVPS
jgi:hypothetical protein